MERSIITTPKGRNSKTPFGKFRESFIILTKTAAWKRNAFIRKNGNIYYVDAKGAFATGWKKINKKQFYFSQRGRAVSGLKTINGKQYYFSKRGEMLKRLEMDQAGQNVFSRQQGRMMKTAPLKASTLMKTDRQN